MKFPWTTSIVDVLKNDNKLEDKLQHVVKCNLLATKKMRLNFNNISFVSTFSLDSAQRGHQQSGGRARAGAHS